MESLPADAAGVSAGFAAEAEGLRREGNPQAALRTARAGLARRPDDVGGRVAAALALIDLGRADEARTELEALWGLPAAPAADAPPEAVPAPDAAPPEAEPVAGDGGLDAELERALAEARPEREAMLDADAIAQQAMRAAELDDPEPDLHAFRTETMASLLERQGDVAGARAIRMALGSAPGPTASAEAPAAADAAAAGEPSTTDATARLVETLERWLDNLKRGRA